MTYRNRIDAGSGGVNNGFTDFSGVFSRVNYPGAYASALTGINDAGSVIGVWPYLLTRWLR